MPLRVATTFVTTVSFGTRPRGGGCAACVYDCFSTVMRPPAPAAICWNSA